MTKTVIMGIKIGQREEDALKVQKLLTEHGCIIKTRLGLHAAPEAANTCSSIGLVLLEFFADKADEIKKLEDELSTIESVSVSKMSL